MSTVTLCDGCLDEIEETVCQHQTRRLVRKVLPMR